jgi:hypothetical protein
LLCGDRFRELLNFPFISKFRVGFETQLMSLTKILPTVINVGRSADISIPLGDEKNEPLLHRGLVTWSIHMQWLIVMGNEEAPEKPNELLLLMTDTQKKAAKEWVEWLSMRWGT